MDSALPDAKFGFSKVTLYKNQALGRGSYGSVCKAKCDSLTCAAKITHSVLFDPADPGVRSMMNRFLQECQLLAAIRHPNIVQYLGTHTDEATGLPVLLMELMDENLTRYLEAMHPLHLHTQLTFSLDVASALDYLHSNSILHRDLSSNNILLLGDRRAKVTDFGMSRLEKVSPRITPATMCPGTLFYMPPEALKEKPLHTDKLDVFSFGVVLIQILTGKFPEPSERFTTLQVPDPSNKKQSIEAQVAVKEVVRRQNHIGLIKETPLLQVALACLKDRQEDRPAAKALCDQLEEIRVQEPQNMNVQKMKKDLETLQGLIEEKQSVIEKKDILLERVIQDKQFVIEVKDRIIKAQEAKMSMGLALRWKRSKNAPVKFKGRGYTIVIGSKAYFYPINCKNFFDIYQYDSNTESWERLPRPPEWSHPIVTGCNIVGIYNLFLTYITVNGKLFSYMPEKKWIQKFPPIVGNPSCIQCTCTSTRDKVLVFPGVSRTGYIMDLNTLEWTCIEQDTFYNCCYYWRFAHHGMVYQAAGIGPNQMFQAYPENEIKNGVILWKSLRDMPHYCQTPISFGGQILGIGGRTHHREGEGQLIKDVHRYDVESNTWAKLGEMEVARCDCMVAVVDDKLIVVGGEDSGEDTSRVDMATIM